MSQLAPPSRSSIFSTSPSVRPPSLLTDLTLPPLHLPHLPHVLTHLWSSVHVCAAFLRPLPLLPTRPPHLLCVLAHIHACADRDAQAIAKVQAACSSTTTTSGATADGRSSDSPGSVSTAARRRLWPKSAASTRKCFESEVRSARAWPSPKHEAYPQPQCILMLCESVVCFW